MLHLGLVLFADVLLRIPVSRGYSAAKLGNICLRVKGKHIAEGIADLANCCICADGSKATESSLALVQQIEVAAIGLLRRGEP